MIGERFTRYTVIAKAERRQSWICQCDCGEIRVVYGFNLKSGKQKSCGCYKKEVDGSHTVTHNMSHSREYSSWHSMHTRCSNKNAENYPKYGGSGVSVCDRWGCFENFYEDMGSAPPNCTLDRKNPSGNYEPTNCRWATNADQQSNKNNTVMVLYDNSWITAKQYALDDDRLYSKVYREFKKKISGAEMNLKKFDPPILDINYRKDID